MRRIPPDQLALFFRWLGIFLLAVLIAAVYAVITSPWFRGLL